LKSYPTHFSEDNRSSFNNSNVIVDLEHHLTINSDNADANANTNTCITAHKCTVCLDIPRRPAMLSKCGHIFCDECIKKAVHPVRYPFFNCPTCRTLGNCLRDLSARDEWPCLMRQVWTMMRIKCMFCNTFQGSPFEVDQHERWSCEKRTISCESACCQFVGTIDQVVEHILNCEHVLVCCLGCNYIINLSSIAKHDCEEVKLRISMLQPDSQARIRKGQPGEFGNIFTWAVEMQLIMIEPSITFHHNSFTSTSSEEVTQALEVDQLTQADPTATLSTTTSMPTTPPAQAQNPISNMQTPTSTPALTSTPNAPRRRLRTTAAAPNTDDAPPRIRRLRTTATPPNTDTEGDADNGSFGAGTDTAYLQLARLAGILRPRRNLFE